MNFKFTPGAENEFLEAVLYHVAQRHELGVYFIRAVRNAIEFILKHPHTFPFVRPNLRRYFIGLYPYSILYTLKGETVIIVAVAHCKRRPDYWLERMDDV